YSISVGLYRNQTVKIGPQKSQMPGAQARQNVLVRMPERVLESSRDHGDERGNTIEKGFDCRRFRPVMPHLKNIRIDRASIRQKTSLHRALHVAGKQETPRSERNPEGKRIVVPGLDRSETLGRRQNLDLRPGKRNTRTGP